MYPIVLASDKTYAMPLATTLRSITESNRRSWPLEIYILHDGFSPELQKKIADSLPNDGPGMESSAVLNWVYIEVNRFAGFATGALRESTKHISNMAYARLLIPEILPVFIPRALYLDVDLLVLEDLRPLWETDLGENVVGAVSDFDLHTTYLDQGFDPEFKRANHPDCKGLPSVPDYFNSGVLLFNLDRWRKEGITEKAFAYSRSHTCTPIVDQDALNVACNGRWKKLEGRWNIQDHRHRKMTREEGGIVHFVTGFKPWLATSRSPSAGLYDYYRERTLFNRTPLEKVQDILIRLGTGIRNVLKRGGLRKGSVSLRALVAG